MTTPNRKEKIDKIYEVFADKTLKPGCLLWGKVRDRYGEFKIYVKMIKEYGGGCMVLSRNGNKGGFLISTPRVNERKIIGSRVMINHVLEGIGYDETVSGAGWYGSIPITRGDEIWLSIVQMWKHKNKPVDDQPDLLVDFLYQFIMIGQ